VAAAQSRSMDSPDETRTTADKGRMQVVEMGGVTVGRAELDPGWRWSDHVKPIAQTDSCQVSHTGYVISGRLKVTMDDGSEINVGPGDAYVIPPGHDAEVQGDEKCVAVEFSGAANWAKPAG
jgi:quercetin dioxygenase-like cupin family protein